MNLTLTTNLRKEYQDLWDSARITYPGIVKERCAKILPNKSQYQAVSSSTGVPWEVIASIHSLEASLDFSKHLHNGDSLNSRTKHVPSGRPKAGTPPFTWANSAIDALLLKPWSDWSIPGTLFFLEKYNGFGYRYRAINSPYLWSFTQHYKMGKFIKDGTFSPTALSKQIGAGTLLIGLNYSNESGGETLFKPKIVWGSNTSEHNFHFQEFLNKAFGYDLLVDGWIGDQTSDAMLEVFGEYAFGDPRNT